MLFEDLVRNPGPAVLYVSPAGFHDSCSVPCFLPRRLAPTMSRIIVKNLPSRVKETRLRELFSQCGEVTDVKLMKTRSGAFRRFGFVGYVSESQAKAAVQHFNKTFIDASRIMVEEAKPYGDVSLTRPWSKYSSGSSAYLKREKKHKETEGSKTEEGEGLERKQQGLNQQLHKSKLSEMLGDYYNLESDPQFQEFLEAHKHKSKVQTWADSSGVGKGEIFPAQMKKVVASSLKNVKSGEARGKERTVVGSSAETDSESEEMSVDEGPSKDSASAHGTSDMQYLRSKIMATVEKESSSEEDDSDSSGKEEDPEEEEGSDKEEQKSLSTTPFTIKMLGLPFRAKEEDVRVFFHPISVAAVRFTSDNQGRPTGRAYADFRSEADLKSALRRDRDCIGRRYIELFTDEGPQGCKPSEREAEQLKPWELRAASSSSAMDEGIAESGRLFVRNLPFTSTEEHLTELFGTFGPLTEVTTPLDKNTNKPTGLAFVTFMLPEHAVKAYNALDGQIFQGRLMHILPAKVRQGKEDTMSSSTPARTSGSYKKQKEGRMKSQAGSGHDWNSLFLGANAVVDAIAERYSTEKSAILDPESSHSAAVRMALGETQLVSETREFLTSQGVVLDVFQQSQPKRSKTVILAKNLPFGTEVAELHKLFSPFGSLNRIILPPAGISALVEFLESTHAKTAFKKLAYTKFKHLPLYLEWAPLGVVDGQVKKAAEREEVLEETADEHSTVFVKNLNFSTNEESLRNLFSKVGKARSVSVARKCNMKDPAHPLSMGFGFVEYASHSVALKAIKRLQHCELDGHKLELKLSHREVPSSTQTTKTSKQPTKQKSAKILVRNIPFEASNKEVKELFRTFGELKTVRLPKKFSARGEHRGFGFVEFATKEGARQAFEALCHSTHLYGRRLVLEWADEGDSVEAIRKRTAEHFHGLRVPSSKRTKMEDVLSMGGNSWTQREGD